MSKQPFWKLSPPDKLRRIASDIEELNGPLYRDDVREVADPDTLREIADDVRDVIEAAQFCLTDCDDPERLRPSMSSRALLRDALDKIHMESTTTDKP